MNIKGVIFDFDGTLADTLPLCIKAFKQALLKFTGIEYSDQQIMDRFGPTEEGMIKQMVPDKAEECLEHFLHLYKEFHVDYPDSFEGIKDVLDLLRQKQIKIALVTGKGPVSADISLKYLNLLNYFDIIETGSPDGAAKPYYISKVLSRWNLKPEETAYVGDTAYDVTAAKEAGIIPLSVLWASTSNYDSIFGMNPHAMFNDVGSFINWIELNTKKSINLKRY